MAGLGQIAAVTDLVVRSLALGAAALAGIVAVTNWAVRNRRIAPMGALSRTVRSLGDPFLRPIERRLALRGGNPRDASLWLVGITVVVGLLLINGTRWIFEVIYSLSALGGAAPIVWVRAVVGWIFGLLILALFARFVGTWLGVPSTRPWMRLATTSTEWLLRPIRRFVPPVGRFDLSPLLGYLVLMLLSSLIQGILLRG